MPLIRREQEGGGEPDINRTIGPFYSPEGVMKRLSIDSNALTQMVQSGRIIALPTVEGRVVYPTRQFTSNEDDTISVNPAVEAAFRSIAANDDITLALILEDNEFGLLWTIAGVLLQPDAQGDYLLYSLQQNLTDSNHECWQKLNDLNGIISGIKKVLPQDGEN